GCVGGGRGLPRDRGGVGPKRGNENGTGGGAGGGGFTARAPAGATAPTTTADATGGNARRHSGRGVATVCTLVGCVRGDLAIASSSARTSPIACQRRFGCFSRHRRSKSPIRGSRSGGSLLMSGSRTRTEASTSGAVSP